MHLSRFEELADPVILERGKNYFDQGRVMTVSAFDPGEYGIMVQGSEPYQVYIRLDPADFLLVHHCECPYTANAVCKHKVAALYALSEVRSRKEEMPSDSLYQKIQEELREYSSEQLVQLILNHIKRDAAFRYRIGWELGVASTRQDQLP